MWVIADEHAKLGLTVHFVAPTVFHSPPHTAIMALSAMSLCLSAHISNVLKISYIHFSKNNFCCLVYGCLANSFSFGNSRFTHSQEVVSINAFCLLVGQCGDSSMELLICQLAFVNLIGRERSKQRTVFDAVTTVKRVVGFVIIHFALIGLFCFAVCFKDVKHFIGNINKVSMTMWS